MFIVHREGTVLINMEFLMYNSGLHYYKLINKYLLFLNTFSKNKEGFIKRKIKSDVKAQELQHTLVFPTAKGMKWITRSNQGQDYIVDTKDMDNAKSIWGKDVTHIKGKLP